VKFTAYIGFVFEIDDPAEAEEYARLLVSALDWPSKDPRFDERRVNTLFVERVESGEGRG